MTTIAWDGETLAADRQTTSYMWTYRHHSKIEQVPGGYIAGCGEICQIQKFVKWWRGGRRKKQPELDDFSGIVVVRGKISLWEGGAEIPYDLNEKFAIGSGWCWAMAAMDHGKTAVEAVEYAATRDNATGGGVDSVRPTVRKRK